MTTITLAAPAFPLSIFDPVHLAIDENGEQVYVYLVVIDEYAYFSATVGDRKQQAEFAALTRDLVARGRAAGVIVILATQRPSHQVIDPSLRDLFGYRWA